jgi:hypothetical protein
MAVENARQILRNIVFSLDGQLMSTAFNDFQVTIGRERLPHSNLYHAGKFSDKGDLTASLNLREGYGTASQAKLFYLLNQDDQDADFLYLLRSNTKSSPADAPGNPALIMGGHVISASAPVVSGQIQRISGEMAPNGQPYLGFTLYTSLAAVDNPITAADSPVTSLPVELGELQEGYELTLSIHCHSITGTGVVEVTVELLSDVDDTFASPTVQATLPLIFTNEDPAPVGRVLAPKAQTLVINGDTDPVPSEPFWAVRITVNDADIDGEVELSAAAALTQK